MHSFSASEGRLKLRMPQAQGGHETHPYGYRGKDSVGGVDVNCAMI